MKWCYFCKQEMVRNFWVLIWNKRIEINLIPQWCYGINFSRCPERKGFMFIVTLNKFSNLTVHRCRYYVKNLTLRTVHGSKHCLVKVWFLWRKRSFASTSVLVVFVAETLVLIQVFSEKFRSFSSVSETRDFLKVDVISPLLNTHDG